jgi:hypothetical protein
MRTRHAHDSCAGTEDEVLARPVLWRRSRSGSDCGSKAWALVQLSHGQISAQGAHICGQPVQNLCFTCAQHIDLLGFCRASHFVKKYRESYSHYLYKVMNKLDKNYVTK